MSDEPTMPGPAAEAIFRQALERLVPEERAAYLAEACAGDAPLRAAVGVLLRAYDERVLRELTLPGPAPAKVTLSEGPGSIIGRYRLMEKIGEGGCGVVFLAEQTEPVRRSVALKIVRLGMDTEEVVARFEAERQTLAIMEHPHIAQVLDAGATPAGRPYFVMELVRGEPITRFCDEHRLNPAARLHLFVQICQAVQHAHQKGVIHRDLKPSNILVAQHDGLPVPKVIDFGIAKATAGRLTNQTQFTAYEQFVGTPAYMSPEQAGLGGADIDTRSDVYSLGVLLYELLTGQPPLNPEHLHSAGVDEVRRLIREVEPARPSALLATLSAATLAARASQRSTDVSRLVSGVRGDLDWIVMRCLEKDRARRYDSASALADDIGRYLHNEPITARPPGKWYLLQKLARRHRAVFVTASAVSLALIIGFGAALRYYLSERAARRLAEEQTELAQAAHAKTQLALSHADFLVALDLIADDRDPEAVAHLVRALMAAPDDRAALTLLASLLTNRAWLVPLTKGVQTAKGTPPPPRGSIGQPGGPRGRGGPNRGNSQWVATSPDGKWILKPLPYENAVRLYTVSTSTLSPSVPLSEPLRHASDVTKGTFSVTNTRLLTTTWLESVSNSRGRANAAEETWEFPENPALLLSLSEAGAVTMAGWSHDGRMIATVTADDTVRTWDATTGHALSAPMVHDQPVHQAVFSPDGTRLATLTQDNALRVWDAASGRPLFDSITLATAGGPGARGSGNAFGRGQPVSRSGSLAFSADGRHILVSRAGRFARIRDAATGQPVPALKSLEEAPVSSAVYSPDGRRILTSGQPADVRLWDATTGEVVLEMAKITGQVSSSGFSPDGKMVVTTSNNGQARLWDANTGEPVLAAAISQGENASGFSAVVSPDGKRVLTFSRQERAARVWDAETGDPLSALIQPDHAVDPAMPPQLQPPFAASFSPDGRWVVTEGRLDATAPASARIWDTTTGLPVSVPALGESVALSPDGKRLLIIDAEKRVKVVLFADQPGPGWLPDLAEALARCKLDDTGSLNFSSGKPLNELQQLVAQEKDQTQPLVIWARRELGMP